MFASGMAVTFLVALTAIDAFWTPARLRSNDARTSLYQITIGYLWPMAGIAALILGIGYGGHAFGLRAADFSQLHGIYAALLATGIAVTLVFPPSVLLPPTTSRERKYFAILAVTAGITEEIIYRALPFAILATWWPGGDPRWYAVIAGVLFGLAHIYRGPIGMAATALLGTVLGLVYASTGSLLTAMVLHTVVDLRLLLVPGARRSSAAADETK